MNEPKTLKSIDLFSGIGGFRLATEDIGFKCIGYSEIDKPALEVYNKNFENINCENLGDIGKLDIESIKNKYNKVDLITGGVPCQPWSVGGKNRGFNDPRGICWFDTIRLIEATKPKVFILENVPGITYKKHQKSFNYILRLLKEIGYRVEYQIFNSKNFRVPQDRDRLFIIGWEKTLNINPKETIKNIEDQKIEYTGENEYKPYTLCDLRGGAYTIHSWELTKTSTIEKEICNWLLKNRRKLKYSDKDGSPIKASEIRRNLKLKKEPFYKAIKSLIDLKIITIIDNSYIEFRNRKLFLGIGGVYRIYYKNTSLYPTLVSIGNNDYIIDEKVYSKKEVCNYIINKKYRELRINDYKKIQGFPESFISSSNPKEAKKQYGNSVVIPLVKIIVAQVKNQLLTIDS